MRRAGLLVALLLALLVVAAGCRSVASGSSDDAGVEARPPHRADDAARQLHVTCTADGPKVDATVVEARSSGVVLDLESAPAGAYLTHDTGADGLDGGEPAAGRRTYAFPPGAVVLGCAAPPGMDQTGTVTITVEDPHGYWRDATLSSYGCTPGTSQPSWAIGTEPGRTADDAVDRLLEQLGPEYAAHPAPTGYSGAATQTWLALADGVPALSIQVTRRRSGYLAGPDKLCNG